MGNIKKMSLMIRIVALSSLILCLSGTGLSDDGPNASIDPYLKIEVVPGIYHIGDSIQYMMSIKNLNPTYSYNISRIWDEYPDGYIEEFLTGDPIFLGPGDTLYLTPTYVYVVRSPDIIEEEGGVINKFSANYSINGYEGSCTIEVVTKIAGSIGGLIWQDLDCDGDKDVGEPGISDINVGLYLDDRFLTTRITDLDGTYLFTDLWRGSYSIYVNDSDLFEDFELTTPPEPRYINLGPGKSELNVDFGYCELATWNNPWNNDCIFSNSEISLAIYYWVTKTPLSGHIISDSEIDLFVYQWATHDVCN